MRLSFFGKIKELNKKINDLEQKLEESNRDKIAINNEIFNLSDIHRVIFKESNLIEGVHKIDFVLKNKTDKYEHIIIDVYDIDKFRIFQEQFINKYYINWFQFNNNKENKDIQWN